MKTSDVIETPNQGHLPSHDEEVDCTGWGEEKKWEGMRKMLLLEPKRVLRLRDSSVLAYFASNLAHEVKVLVVNFGLEHAQIMLHSLSRLSGKYSTNVKMRR